MNMNMNSSLLREVFDQVVTLIRETPMTTDLDTTSTGDKLRLYGLFKHVATGPCSGTDFPSVLRPQAYAKYQAWSACQELSKDQAMSDYVRLAASQDNWLGQKCTILWEEYKDNDKNDNDAVPLDQAQVDVNDHDHSSQATVSSTVKAAEKATPALQKTNSLEKKTDDAAGYFWGMRLMIPRGQLDISYSDLAFSLKACCAMSSSMRRYRYYDKEIHSVWQKATGRSSVVGLSVRSLFDLYLLSKQYPPGSEIIVVPPINIPGMMQIMAHHQLKVVAVDLPESLDKSSDTDTAPLVAVDCDAIEKAVTVRTVAVLVVHPFGMISATQADMVRIQKLASEKNLDVLEDCAECFSGLGPDCYLGSPHADVCFFSFGLIKTATALGGGVAVVRDESVVQAMNRLHFSLYRQQATREYLVKVIKSMILYMIADSLLLYTLIARLSSMLGLDLDAIVTPLLRSFKATNDGNSEGANRLRRQLRRRPSPALLSVLHRRFRQSVPLVQSVARRVDRCRFMTQALRKEAPDAIIPVVQKGAKSTFWLYPILSLEPNVTCRNLRNVGFDATQGASQLGCVAPPGDCPRAAHFMKNIVYLPISSRPISDANMRRLARALRAGRRDDDTPKPLTFDSTLSSHIRRHSSWDRVKALLPIVVAVALFARSALRFIWVGVEVVTILGLAVLLASHLLRWSVASFYLDSSSGFATYNDLLLGRSRESDDKSSRKNHAVEDTGSPSNIQKESSPFSGVIGSMKVLDIPSQSNKSTADPRTVILTGATGFIGSTLFRELLFHREALSISCVILICRSKRKVSAKARIDKLLAEPLFEFLSKDEKESLVNVVEGDVTKPNAGISDDAISQLRELSNITHILHCAASVSFTQTLTDAAQANISSALELQGLTAILGGKEAKFVHVSTAFVHGGLSGSQASPLPEHLHSLGKYDPAEVYSSMLGTQFYASKAMNDLRFHNSYTFSKCICEHLLLQTDVDTIIIRPSIVGPAVENPFEGWAGGRPSTLVAAACLYLSYQWNIWCFGSQHVPCIPVDILSRFIVAKAFRTDIIDASVKRDSSDDSSLSEDDFEKISTVRKSASSDSHGRASDVSLPDTHSADRRRIYTAAWDATSDLNTTFSWKDYAVTLTQVGSVLGYFSRPTAYIGLLVATRLLPQARPSLEQFEKLHCLLVRRPFGVFLQLCSFLGFDTSQAKRLVPFLDLPVLFFPFMNTSFYFRSELVAPTEFSGDRYVFNSVAASHFFVTKAESSGSGTTTELKAEASVKGSNLNRDVSFLRVGGSAHRHNTPDAWWALTQPRGSYFIRFAGWLLVKILRATCSEITVDTVSFTSAMSKLKSTEGSPRLVLAPTHRSLLDFLVLSFVFFSVPELQVDIPSIAAAEEFERLPVVGWLARCMGAFFVRRGRGHSDSELASSINCGGSNAVIEVFLEGTRSRDRRFAEPKTGFMKCLRQTGETYVIVPITISYERIPEQEVMATEASSGIRRSMNVPGMFSWLKSAAIGRVNLGRVHVSACSPVIMDGSVTPDCSELVDEIQLKQQEHLYISTYHITAASRLLSLDPPTVQNALLLLGCSFWPQQESSTLAIPTELSELCGVMLQCSPWLALLFRSDRPDWSRWLHRLPSSGVDPDVATSPSVVALAKSLGKLFDDADECYRKAIEQLKAKGYQEPKSAHILQVARKLGAHVPAILLRASILIHRPSTSSNKLNESAADVPKMKLNTRCLVSDEALGFWGFHDSSFVVSADRNGSPFVTMKGDRYACCGKPMKRLLPFIESETQIKVDPLDEAFGQVDAQKVVSPCQLDDMDIELLKIAVERISVSEGDRVRHGTGHSLEDVFIVRAGHSVRAPDAVAWPKSEEEVEKVLQLAKSKHWCLIPFGGGTNVSQATACPSYEVEPRPIISVDMKRMNRVKWVNEEDGIACIEAGITGRDLVEEMARLGFTIGHEPDSIEFSTLGGWIATKASGMKRNRYGNIEDIVKGVRVAGSNGVLWHGRDEASVWGRESCGIDLSSLIIGSEGCLGIITSAVIRIWPLPDVKDYDSLLLSDFDQGLHFVRDVSLLNHKSPASCRLLDNEHFRLGQALQPEDSWMVQVQKASAKSLLNWSGSFDPMRVVCVTISYEGSKDEVSEQKRAMGRLFGVHGGIRLGATVGKAGYDMTFMIAYLRDFAMTYHFLGESFETFAPWSRVEAIVRVTKERIIREHAARCLPGLPFVGCRVTQLYHEGVCLYFYLCMNFEKVDNAGLVFSEIERAARSEILLQGGSLSHHHGIGKVRSSFLDDINSPALQGAMKSVKQGMDPDNIFAARNGAFASI